MLYLSRKVGESIIINNNIVLTVVEVRGKTAKLGFTFPPDASILRKEIHDKVMAENLAAASSSGDDDLGGMDFDLDFDSAKHQDTPTELPEHEVQGLEKPRLKLPGEKGKSQESGHDE